MPCYDLPDVYLSQLLRIDTLLNWDKMHALGQSNHDYPNLIHSTRNPRQLPNEIHGNLLPFPNGNIQRLHLAVRLLMLGLNFLTSVVPLYIPSYILFHARPQIIRTKITIGIISIYAPFRSEPGSHHLNTEPILSDESVLFLHSLNLCLSNLLQKRSNHGRPQTNTPDRSRDRLAAKCILP